MMKTKWARVAGVITCGLRAAPYGPRPRLGPPLIDGFPTFLHPAAPPLCSWDEKREECDAGLQEDEAECGGKVVLQIGLRYPSVFMIGALAQKLL